MGETIEYNPNSPEHNSYVDYLRTFRAELRTPIGRSRWKEYGRSSNFMGYELFTAFPNEKPSYRQRESGQITFIKRDLNNKHRLVMKLAKDQNNLESVCEDKAWIWFHDNRVKQLGQSFFIRANMPA